MTVLSPLQVLELEDQDQGVGRAGSFWRWGGGGPSMFRASFPLSTSNGLQQAFPTGHWEMVFIHIVSGVCICFCVPIPPDKTDLALGWGPT